jgi:GxxExxY protein
MDPRNDAKLNALTGQIIASAIEVHKALGPGLLESTYEECLAHELKTRDIAFARQMPLPVQYKGLQLECCYRVDLFVADTVIVELKSVDKLEPIHEAQLLTYMKLSRAPLGLLINFNVPLLKDGIKRMANTTSPSAPSAPLR